MKARNNAIFGIVTMSALLVLYFFLAGVKAVALIMSGDAIALAMGIALVILPIIGVWALVREIMFGYSATKLVDQLEAEGNLPDDLFVVEGGKRPTHENVEAVFPKYQQAAETEPEEWRNWMRLSIVYDAAGDRKRARQATRQAISVEHN